MGDESPKIMVLEHSGRAGTGTPLLLASRRWKCETWTRLDPSPLREGQSQGLGHEESAQR